MTLSLHKVVIYNQDNSLKIPGLVVLQEPRAHVIGRSSDLSRPMRLPGSYLTSGKESIGLIIKDLQQQVLFRIYTGFQITPLGAAPTETNDVGKDIIKKISWYVLLITKKHLFPRSFQQPLLQQFLSVFGKLFDFFLHKSFPKCITLD